MTMGGSTHFSVFLLVAIILLCSSSKTVNATCYGKEKQALMDFKKDLKDPFGRLLSWIHDIDCCKWEGVVCSNRSGRVIQLHLQSPVRKIDDFGDQEISALSGKISHSLQNLTHLRYLDLSLNDFSGIPIPSFFGSLRSLRYLNLSGAGFQGMVPYQLGNLSSLRTLSIGGDPSYLQVDNLQWLAGLSNLEHLDMSGVNLRTASNWLEVINTIPSLVEIHLSSCHLDLISHHLGRDTFVFHANFSSLTVLDLSRNFFGYVVPRWIFSLTALASLHLSDNSFEGPLPRGPWNLTSLQHLDLSVNYLNGSLPDELIHLNNLISLDLSVNQFEGSLEGIWNWSSLASLDLSVNNFATFLPSQLSTLTSLISLALGNNHFRGSIPSSIANISNLQYLGVSNNNLSSSLPSEVFTSKDLITLGASSNRLNGPIPSAVGNCTKLERLLLHNNALSGSIPSNLGRCTQLKELWLNDNAVSGSIPSNLGRCTQLKELWLGDNALSGSIPSNLGKLSSLEFWDVSHNKLTGTLPESLGQLSKLEELRIYDNLMEGIMSESPLDNLTALRYFYASENSLTLKVSASWTPRAQFETLALSSRKLGPQFPAWIRSQKFLGDLNLSFAGISDTIPPWLFNSSLISIDLSHNQIHGGISHILCEVKNEYHDLYYLDLGENSLSGEIPNCWMNYPNLYHINLNSNNFTGSIPRSLFYLEDLHYLGLGNNSLTGPITFDFVNHE
ncbi:probable LRR receptor-like serine/threonine-protein kinase At1g34110 [Coffea eugenioides]|uniref:probable LRR receptor-like serine/threonine-protein kinase At1g34110 n=1 Tax=Coffea eugenioides TaxID=49369 RepID=UPI000F60BB1A|nr:probable LRR receptor-like serine/threonine-protein kinase At1g34110 [Coffea eugenioides]